MSPNDVLDRNEACRRLGISRQTLNEWIRKGKLKVWKRAGNGPNAALLFTRQDVDMIALSPQFATTQQRALSARQPEGDGNA